MTTDAIAFTTQPCQCLDTVKNAFLALAIFRAQYRLPLTFTPRGSAVRVRQHTTCMLLSLPFNSVILEEDAALPPLAN